MKLSRLLAVIMFAFAVQAISQDNLRIELFGDVDKIMQQAHERKADLYGPLSFQKAMEYYTQADDLYKRGKSLEEIREAIGTARAYFVKAMEAVKIGEVAFASAMAAREDASSAGAPKFMPELWSRAETEFRKATRELEGGNINAAKIRGGEAENLFRSAELEAIKANYLSPARELLRRAEEIDAQNNAPITLNHARRLAAEVENLLKQNRYDTDEARVRAQEARNEAAHALYLHQTIADMKNRDKSFEDVYLAAEAQVVRITAALGIQTGFESGLEGPVTEILQAIRERDVRIVKDGEALMRAAETIRQKEGEVDNLRQQVASMENRLGTLTETEKQLQQKLSVKRQQEERMRALSLMFTEWEGSVLREGDNVIIRLYGLTFPVGKNTIEPEFYPLLSKVQDAIQKFPGARVVIEGHTDSQGSDEVNQTLSEGRAKAVAEYLMANMGVEIPVNHQGYGESRPVASNDTAEGRARNRRIDVVITP